MEPTMLAAVNDMLDVRVCRDGELARIEARQQARDIARGFVNLAAALVKEKRLDGAATLEALIAPGMEERAPFLLRLATHSVHDRPMAEAMCNLIEALGDAAGRKSVVDKLLRLESPAQLRTAASLPEGLSPKYTDFLGRLMGDGQGEWDDDGAVHALGRLKEAKLLPERSQVKAAYSSCRWQKLSNFVDASMLLRKVAPWADPPSAMSLEESERRLGELLSAASGRTGVASGAVGATRQGAGEGIARHHEQLIRQAVAKALQKGWASHRQVTGKLTSDVALVESGLSDRLTTKLLDAACGHLTRMSKQAPPRVFERVLAEVLRDPALPQALAPEPQHEAGARKGMGPCADAKVLELLEPLATRHVEALLDQRQKQKLVKVLPEDFAVDDYCLPKSGLD